jgi:DNA-binding response OmpR family regulator
MDDFVVKPVDMAALVAAVTRAGRTPRRPGYETVSTPSVEKRRARLPAGR